MLNVIARLLCRIDAIRALGFDCEPQDPQDKATLDAIVEGRWEEWKEDADWVITKVLIEHERELSREFGRSPHEKEIRGPRSCP